MAKNKNEIIKWLENHSSKEGNSWRVQAEWEQENKLWLRHSRYIAVIMLSRMDAMRLSQTALAEKMGCSQQYVSKILKGKENLSLETIAKIEDALGLDFFVTPQPSDFDVPATPSMVADETPMR